MGRLRIIAGAFRGRRIDVPDGSDVRPTPERVREALFDILGPGGPGRRVLDAYAGSGALGLEALSRGASGVVFVERDPEVAHVLRRNTERLGVSDRCEIVEAPALRAIRQTLVADRFDLIMADPPYSLDEGPRFLRHGLEILAPRGLLVLEREARRRPADAPRPPSRTTCYGRTCLDFYRTDGIDSDAVGMSG